MGEVIILPETTRKPITLIGKRAGMCWGRDVDNDKRNYERGLECLEKNHGRALEYINIETILKGWSARVIREWYTHIGGAPTRLQESTRYVNYENFNFVTPATIQNNPQAQEIYENTMNNISDALGVLMNSLKIPKEDVAMLLPLGMQTTIVDKRNFRSAMDMSHQRMCSRAYLEYRELFREWANQLRSIDEEWEFLIDNYFKPKCEVLGYCPEGKPCKAKYRKEDTLSQTE